MTIEFMHRFGDSLKLAGLARRMGMTKQALSARMQRGGPELDEERFQVVRELVREMQEFLDDDTKDSAATADK